MCQKRMIYMTIALQAVNTFQSTLNPQIPRSTPAWDTFGFIPNVVTKFCKADPG